VRRRCLVIAIVLGALVSDDARAEETIVFMRHGEKPSDGYGQLTCQGFNRSLAIPTVLTKLVQNIMNTHGVGIAVPAWTSTDYDSLYVVRVNYIGNTINAQFSHEKEGLNGQPNDLPVLRRSG